MSCLDREDRMDRRQGRHRLCHDATAAPPGAAADRLAAPHLRARLRRTRKRGHGAGDFGTMVHTEDGGADLDHVTRSRGREASRERPRHRRRARRRQPLRASATATPTTPGSRASSASSWPATTAVCTWKQQHDARREHALRHPLHRRPARLGGRARLGHPAHRGRRRHLDAQLPAPVAGRSFYDVFVRGQQGWIVGDSGHGAQERRRRRHLDSSSRCPIQLAANWIRSRVAGARRARSRRRLRRARLPRRRRQDHCASAPASRRREDLVMISEALGRSVPPLPAPQPARRLADHRPDDRVLRVPVHADQSPAAVPRLLPEPEQDQHLREGVHAPRGSSVHQDLQRVPADVRERQRPHR